MTLANVISDRPAVAQNLTLRYQVAMPQPENHCFEVTLAIDAWTDPTLVLQMAVWTPGSYLVREYARHVQAFSAAATETGQPLTAAKISKNQWQIEIPEKSQNSDITVRYTVYAHELTVRTNHLDASHGYFNGAALFFYIPGQEQSNFEVEILPPQPTWQVFTSLAPHLDRAHTYLAPDLDTLIDSPFEIGPSTVYDFEAEGKPHQWVIWGSGNYDIQKIIADTQAVITTEKEIFGELPYEQYAFLLHLAMNKYGGLEHKNCCSLIYNRLGFRDRDKYCRFMQLVAHEFFHLWNVKRLRPEALEKFDYGQENYTRSLWFCEGTTSYYDVLIPHLAGIYGLQGFCEALTKDISRYLLTPGRTIQTLTESSFDAWIKLYRREAHSENNQISYYLKGEMVSLLLDLLIRKRHENRRSLDDVMRQMWEQFGRDEVGYSEDQLRSVVESVADCDLTEFFAQYLDGLAELPLAEALADFGLQIQPQLSAKTPPYLGIRATDDQGKAKVKFVAAGSPAAAVGIAPDNELLALDGWRLTAKQLNDRLLDYQPQERIQLTVFQDEALQTYEIQLGDRRPQSYKVLPVKNPTPEQSKLLKGWLKV
ncbi:MAG: M61 family metallopeptidase [Spirulina sp. SIO3F2]|nr:M61 family metallopeptidase [Spirulina sp. SIO3F2]